MLNVADFSVITKAAPTSCWSDSRCLALLICCKASPQYVAVTLCNSSTSRRHTRRWESFLRRQVRRPQHNRHKIHHQSLMRRRQHRRPHPCLQRQLMQALRWCSYRKYSHITSSFFIQNAHINVSHNAMPLSTCSTSAVPIFFSRRKYLCQLFPNLLQCSPAWSLRVHFRQKWRHQVLPNSDPSRADGVVIVNIMICQNGSADFDDFDILSKKEMQTIVAFLFCQFLLCAFHLWPWKWRPGRRRVMIFFLKSQK